MSDEGEDCYDETPPTIVSDVTRLIETSSPIKLEDIPRLEQEVARLRSVHDDATESELGFVSKFTALAFAAARRRALRA